MTKYHLLQVTPACGYGGAERYLFWIAQGAMARGWRVTLVCEDLPVLHPLMDEYRSIGAGVSTACISESVPQVLIGRAALTRSVARYLWLLVRHRPDAVHLSLPLPLLGAGAIVAAALLRIPALLAFQLAPTVLDVPSRQRAIYRWARQRRQAWVAVSEHNRKALCATFGCGAEELSVIYNGSALSSLVASETDRMETRLAVRREWGVADDAFVILSVGRLCHQKGFDVLICAIREVVQRLGTSKPIVLIIAGDGPYLATLQSLAEAQGVAQRVTFLGWYSPIERLHCAADLFAFPSREEGAPFAMLEAMASGLPVVAARFGGAEEFLQHGENGWLVDVDDSRQLAEAIVWACQHPEAIKQRAQRGQASAARFTRQAMVENTLSLVSELLGDPKVALSSQET